MFYEEKEISEHLKCPNCRIIFVDPRILECGESMCNDCILLHMDKEKNGIHCIICNKYHEISKNGFNKNLRLDKLIQIKPNEVSRGPVVSDFKLLLNKYTENIKIVEVDFRAGKDKIKKHCDSVRGEVESALLKWHQSIDKSHDEFMEKIRLYENECLVKYDKLDLNVDEYEEFIEGKNVFLVKWEEYLRNFKINDAELVVASREAVAHLDEIQSQAMSIRCLIFNGRLLKFDESKYDIGSDIVGNIKYENIKLFKSQMATFKSFHLKSILHGYMVGAKLAIEPLPNGNFVIAYKNDKNNVNLVILDRTGNVLVENNSIIYTLYDFTTRDFKLYKTKEAAFLYYSINCNNGSNAVNIKVFNENLNFNKFTLRLENDFKDFAVFDTQLFGLSDQNALFGLLFVYDSNLQLVEQFGQEEPLMPYYFAPNVSKIQVNEEYFFLLDTNRDIKLMDRSNGLIARVFKINSSDFYIYMNEYILSYDSSLKSIFVFDFEGKESELSVKDISKNSQLIATFNEELIFFDSDLMMLSF